MWFIDSDDVIEPNCIKQILDAIDGEDAMGCTFQFDSVPENFQVPDNAEHPKMTFKHGMLVKGSNMPFTIIINREYLLSNKIEFKTSISYGEDTFWRYYVWLYTDAFIHTDKVIYHYRNVPTSATNTQSSENNDKYLKSMKEMLYSYQYMYDNFPKGISTQKRDNTKLRIFWSVQNVLLRAIRTNSSNDVLDELTAKGLYPYPMLWRRLFGSRSIGEIKVNLFCLLFPIRPYYRMIAKFLSPR